MVKLENEGWEVLIAWETEVAIFTAYLLALSPLPMLAEMEAQSRLVAALNLPVDHPLQTLRMRRLRRAEWERINQGPTLHRQDKAELERNNDV